MKAIVYGPSALQLAEIEKPVPRDDEVLLKVRAASVNPLDGHLLKTAPRIRSLMSKVLKVRIQRPGADVAGEVESVGQKVTRLKPGDAVFGASSGGAFAEYACPPESRLVQKPSNIGFEAASTLVVAGCTALQGLRDSGGVEPGHKVLVNGASGGVGTFAVQIAKWLGANVTAVCSTRNLDLMLDLGADHVIDYTREDLTKTDERYDVIFDLVGNKPLLEMKRILKPKGVWVGAGVLGSEASMIRMLSGMFNGAILSIFTSQKFTSFVARINKDDLATLGELVENEKIKPVIDRTFTLSETPEAVRYVADKHARGKVVISVCD